MSENSRKKPRFKLYPYVYDILLKTPTGITKAGLHDLSTEGMGLILEETLPTGTNTEILVTIQNKTLKFSGKIVWLNPLEDTFAFRAGIHLTPNQEINVDSLLSLFASSGS